MSGQELLPLWPDADQRLDSARRAVVVLLDMAGFRDAPKDSELRRQAEALLDMLSYPGKPVPSEPWTFGLPLPKKEKQRRGRRPKRAPDLFVWERRNRPQD
ncbi:hypothetical protein [Chelatococcus composti]|uniref:Uncharacterized protein n=1 Tax=Chelatococcus composti TaxID=1743235 RepID=A0A841KI37_9HYPH|nr:hypothetical protein [Chelatococcus composti]MBB6169596.1 hypothetical protein [Chelatococcus composti]MBS7736181.1 hypothetical protein [Chelatococcus composti]GGG48997.1 hypothetical protein GCM10008026_32790 [Chelatococcus composti]